ncbi:daunorubicin ABC transporter ATP-binding protein [Candidatus Bathyarchaeota archaeon ex4484_205]|nr:MAG: daunorubicin ABC transporter ATP-binding protein [Candidatus Bathyarchaeota archaeon ex4484_205]
MPKMLAVQIDNLWKKYGDIEALKGVSLQVRKGEIFGLLGPNGAGKSTLMSCLLGLVEPDKGTIKLLGRDVNDGVKRKIGFCPQDILLYNRLTGRENIWFFSTLYHVSQKDFAIQLQRLIKLLDMKDFIDRRVESLSGGMKRRINLAASLIHNPELLILDEPTVGLDPEARREFWSFIRLIKKEGKTVLLSTHYMDEAEELCDRVAIIDKGEIKAVGSPQELVERYGGLKYLVIHVPTIYIDVAINKLAHLGVKLEAGQLVKRTEVPEKDLREIMKFAQSEKIPIRRIEIKNPDLEDVFLNIAGRRLQGNE